MPINLTRSQAIALVVKPEEQTHGGKHLLQLLQDAATKDDVGLFRSLKEACNDVEEGSRERGNRRRAASNVKAEAEEKSAHDRFLEILNPPGLKETTLLILAIQYHSLKVLRFLLEDARSMVDVEKEGTARLDGEERIPGTTALWTAAALGHIDMVQMLLDCGANINHGSSTNSTPIRAACYDGFLPVVQLLVKRGASVNTCNKYGSGPLHLAGFRGFPALAEYLLQNGADVDCTTTSERETPLHHASVMGHADVVEVLLDHNADCTKKTLHESTPYLLAAAAGENNVVDVFLKRTPVSCEDRVAGYLLLGAASVDKHENIQGAEKAWTLAMDETSHGEGNVELLERPLGVLPSYRKISMPRTRKDVHVLTADRDRTLYFALAIREHILGPKHPEVIHFMRQRGALFADEDRYAEGVALWQRCVEMEMMVAGNSSSEVHQSLVACTEMLAEQVSQQGVGNVADLYQLALRNLQRVELGSTECGKTVKVMLTLLHLWLEVTRALPSEWEKCRRAAKALNVMDITLHKGYFAYTPLHLACDSKTFVHGPKLRKTIRHFPASSVVRLLLETGASVQHFDSRGNSPLHLACQSDSVACVAELLPFTTANLLSCQNEAGKLPVNLTTNDKVRTLLTSLQQIDP